MNNSSLVLLSGGLDSCFALSEALNLGDVKLCVTFDYGQKSAPREIASAANLCAHLGIKHQIVAVPYFATLLGHPFFSSTSSCPNVGIANLDHLDTVQQSAKAVWVPNRNGLFINLAAVIAESQDIDKIYVGFNAEEAVTFADNSKAYLDAVNSSLSYSTRNQVQVQAPAIGFNKSQILKQLCERDFPLKLIWSCYLGDEAMCGHCESCQRLLRAISQTNLAVHQFSFGAL